MKLFGFIMIVLAGACIAAQAGTISGKVAGDSGNSVVYVEKVAGKTSPAPEKPAVMDQKGLRFLPHVLAIQQGTTVTFQNSDTVAHNAFWPSISGNKKLAHNLGTWPQGQTKSFQFDNPGTAALLCNVHPEMSAYIVVSPSPYFASTDSSGNYKIENVPDGKYTVTTWHEGSKNQSKPTTVQGDAKLDFSVAK